MGFKYSSYNCVKMGLIVEEVEKGFRLETKWGADGKELTPFHWDRVRLNLPGLLTYDPALTWICKLRCDGKIASDLFTLVDDERLVGATQELTWHSSHKLVAIQSYLGVQDEARKVQPCSQTPGVWAGDVVHIMQQLGVCTLISEYKWTKMKTILKKWRVLLDSARSGYICMYVHF